MAQIKPFSALRYNIEKAGSIETLSCPPYDIISEEQRLAYLDTNPYNVIRLELPKGDNPSAEGDNPSAEGDNPSAEGDNPSAEGDNPSAEGDNPSAEGDNPYDKAAQILNSWLEDEILTRDMDDGLYIYQEEFKTAVDHGETKLLTGLICRVKLEEFESGIVLPHEETLSKAKEDRLNLLKATGCSFSPIYSLYMDEEHKTLNCLQNLCGTCAPRYSFDDGLVIHRLWLVNDKAAISELCGDFMARKLYIADGHHRYETALNYRRYCMEQNIYSPGSDYVMMMLADMSQDGLVVFPTHRLVRELKDFDPAALLARCEEYFELETVNELSSMQEKLDLMYQKGEKAFGCYFGGSGWTLLRLKDIGFMDSVLPEKSPASRRLDVSVLHNLVLEKLLGIDKENMANGLNLRYTRSLEEALESVDKGESQCAFLLNPTRVEEIGAVAGAGERMPQKSTYFYPKLITGLVMNQLEP